MERLHSGIKLILRRRLQQLEQLGLKGDSAVVIGAYIMEENSCHDVLGRVEGVADHLPGQPHGGLYVGLH